MSTNDNATNDINSSSGGRNLAPTSLERRLELLESRFTTPALPAGISGTAGSTVCHPESGTLGTMTAATTTNNNTSTNSSPSNSVHSFSFTTPLSRSAGGGSQLESSNPLPLSSVRSKRRQSALGNTLHAVNMAAERHMRKVAANNNSPINGNSNNSNNLMVSNVLLLQHDNNRSMSALASTPTSRASSASHVSNQTLLTSHVAGANGKTNSTSTNRQRRFSHPNQRIVAESPPVFVTPHGPKPIGRTGALPKPAAARSLVLLQTNQNTITNTTTKRKSVPKRKQSSIKDTTLSVSTSTATMTVTSPAATSRDSTSSFSKRQRSNNASTTRSSSSKATLNTGATSTTANMHLNSEHSRDYSNPPKTSKTKAPPKNRTINEFFSAANSITSTTTNGSNINSKAPASTATATAATNKEKNTNTNTNSSKLDTSTTTSSTPASELLLKCQKLERQLQDKEEQLKAVTNNRTIIHTALQSALTKTKQELAQLQSSTKQKESMVSKVLEDLLRWKSSQQAKELREQLATDGSRLGRIVFARAGYRTVESWEEGYATKDLQIRKNELARKRSALERRQQKLLVEKKKRQQTLQQHQDDDTEDKNKENRAETGSTASGSGSTSSDIRSSSELELLEAQESVRMHLDNLSRSEKELADEEEALNDEKGKHIRALKRVASEDASRFRTRPKLHNRYILHCLLGKGGFSEVWRGYDLVELREVAVKIHQLDPRWPDSKKENYTKHVSREYEIHRNVRHRRIVSLYDVFEIDNNSFATVLECCKGTDLDTLLKSKKRLPEREARAILLQILSGMQYLSHPSSDGRRQGIIHYDLKPGNILFDQFGDAKITDFGLSKIVDTHDPAESMELTSQGAGTYWYLPPECFITNERVRISNKVDVWSIGVIYYQMLYGKRPFGEGKTQEKLLTDHTMLNAQQVTFPNIPNVSESAKEFLRQCLMYDQSFRPTVGQLCENPYVLSNKDF